MSAENYLHRDPKTGLRILAGDYLDEILPAEVAFQLALRKHGDEEAKSENKSQTDDDADDDIVDLEIFFCDVNCGVLASDRKPSRVAVLTARYLAIYTHSGVLKQKIALESIKRIEFMTTKDDSSGAVLVVLKDSTALPIVFSLLSSNANNNTNGTSSSASPSASMEYRGESPQGVPSSTSSSVLPGGANQQPIEEELAACPTTRIADLRFAVGALCRIRAEEESMEKVREQALQLQQNQQHQESQKEENNEELLQNNNDQDQLSMEEQQQNLIANTATSVNTFVVINTDNSVKLDLLLKSLAGAFVEQETGSSATSTTTSSTAAEGIPPLEIPRVNPPAPGTAASPLVETLERLCRKEKELSYEDARDSIIEAAQRKLINNGFKTSAQRQGIDAVIEGMNIWVGARSNLVAAKSAHNNIQSNLDAMMNALREQHEARNDQLLRLADDAQRVANEHNESIKSARQEVEQIDARIKVMEQELQIATDNYTEAMKHKDAEILEAKQVVDRMRYDLTKGSYSELPSLSELQTECDKLEAAVQQQSARAEELHISAPDKSVMKHLTGQLEEENSNLQEEILSVKKQRRTLTQQLISHRMDLANAEARGEAAQKKSTDLRRRKVRSEADHTRLKDSISKLETRVENLHLKLRRVELEAVVVEDLKREELMHRSMVQSVRQDIRADLLDKRRVERMMKEEQDRRSKSREVAYREAMGYQ